MPPRKPALQLVAPTDEKSIQDATRRRFARLYEEYLAVEAEDAKDAGHLGFVAKWLVHATLPYVQPKGNPPAWGRRSGDVSLLIQPGYYQREVKIPDARGRVRTSLETVSIGYPYGAYPRLILAWIATEVVRTRERELVLGRSLSEFMSNLGRTSRSGGSRGSTTLVRNQMMRLFASNIAVTRDPSAVRWQTDGFRIADNASIEPWWDPMHPNQGTLWQSHLKLTERFYETLVTNPVPVDLRIVKGLSRSAMAIDIYCWLTFRNAVLQRPTKVSWEALMQQFGSESSRWKFRENFEKNLKDVLVLYPQAKLKADSAGLLLLPSPPSIARIA